MQENTPIINTNDERPVRIKKLQELQHAGINPYPADGSARTHSVTDATNMGEGETVAVAGRLMGRRDMGKITFGHVQDETGKVQIVFKDSDLGTDAYKQFLKDFDIGDIIAVAGTRFLTKAGEQSILAQKITLLTKSLLPLPDKFHGLQDEEIRLRKRYLDFISDPSKRDMFYRKSRFWNSMRQFFIREGFLEVETPVLETTPGGADATPFVTHHDALDIDVYLRISMGELWQKRLMVAGFEKTFEIGRQFRNEGMSREHLQDYTQMEFYWAYADYTLGMALVERMYKEVIQETFGTLQFSLDNFPDIDFAPAWERIDYVDTVKQITGLDVMQATENDLRKKLTELGIHSDAQEGKGRLIDSLWKYCRKGIKGPVFLVNHPVAVSPLAKRMAGDTERTERYQIIVAGSELGNGYSELNDPLDQAARFEEQAKMREAGDTEAQMHDRDFVEALEHGMPPTTGFGVSERLFAFLENKPVRECVLFPLMRPSIPEIKTKKHKA